MFFSRRKSNFEPYVPEIEEPEENLEEAAAVEEANVEESAQQEAAVEQPAVEETAPAQDMPALVRPVQPAVVEEEPTIEESSAYVDPNLGALYLGGYPDPEKENQVEANVNEEIVPEEEDAPVINVIEELPQGVDKKFAKENEQMEYEVIIGKNTSFNGVINIDGATRIDGNIEGTLVVNNDLYVGETGVIKAEVKVINATISGTIVGNIKCSGRLELLSSSSISGDIECGALIVAEGASINATVSCGKTVAETPAE